MTIRPILILLLLPLSLSAQISREYFFAKGTNELIDHKYPAAIESFNLLLRIDTTMHDAYFRRAIAKYNLGDTHGALHDFNHAIRLNPVFTYAYFYRSIVRNSMGSHTDALRDLDEVESLRPQFHEIYYSRGISYFYLQQFHQALQNYNLYLRHNPNSNAAYLMRGACQLFLKDTTAALHDYNHAISINTFDPDGYSRRGRLLALLNQNQEALSDFNHAIKLDSTNSINYYFRALTYYNTHKIHEALQDLAHVLHLDPYNALVLYNRAIIHTQLGSHQQALADYNQAAQINPSNVLIYYNRAATHLELGSPHQALSDYNQAINLYPNFANAYLNRSYAKRQTGDLKGAKNDYDIAQKMISDHQQQNNTTHDSTHFSDTNQQFNQLIAFDADFTNKNFSPDLLQYQHTDITLLPLYHITIGNQPQPTTDHTKTYYNPQYEQWRSQYPQLQIQISTSNPQRTPEQRSQWETTTDHLTDSLAYTSGMGYFAKATLLTEQNMYSAANNFYQQALTIEPNNPFYLLNQSAANAQMIDFISNLDPGQNSPIIMDANPTTAIQSQRTTTQPHTNPDYDYSQAIQAISHTIQLLPTLAHAYYNRANLLCRSNQLPQAIHDYSQAIQLYPHFAHAYYNRGLTQIYLHDTPKGCLDISKAGELGIPQAYNILHRYCK